MPKVKVDKELHKRIKQHVEAAGYSSVEEFVQHCIEEELKKHEKDEVIMDRLKGLGYL